MPVKIKKSSGRGTSVREEEDKPQNWSGEQYREFQKKRMEGKEKTLR